MPPLENARHERFAQELLASPARDAYRRAGFKSEPQFVDANASRLKSSDKVAARVRELNAEAAAMAKLSKSYIIKGLIETADKALGRRKVNGKREVDLSAANRAFELLGRELGMFVERRQEVKDELDMLGPDQRAQLIAAMRAALEARQAPAIEAHATDNHVADKPK
jgi:phage terminase small subunit